MDPELKKALDGLRSEVGEKNTELRAAIDEVEKQAKAREATVTELREKLDEIAQANEEREKTLKAMKDEMRVQLVKADPLREKREAVAMLGMVARDMLARELNMPIPQRFAEESERVKQFRATLAEGTGTGIPTILSQEILDTLEETSDILQFTDLQVGVPTKGTIVTWTGRPTLQSKRASTDTDMTESDPTIGSYSWDTEETYFFFPVDNWLLTLSPLALGQRIMENMRDWFLNGLVNWFINADGTASYNSDTGVLNDTQNVYTLGSGKTGFADVVKTDLDKAKAKVLKRGRARGNWLMHLTVLGVLEELNRTGKTPVVSHDNAGNARVLYQPAKLDEDMPDLDSSAKSTAFMGYGDLSAWLVAIAGNGIEIATSKEYFFNRNQTCFRAMGHIDIVRKPINTWVLLKTAAS